MHIRRVSSVYTQLQLQQYLHRINWKGANPEPTLDSLTRIMQLHLCSIPFGNAAILYEKDVPELDYSTIFDKIVLARSGYVCYGTNLLLREMLRAIGFRCYSTSARVNMAHPFNDGMDLGSLAHMVIFAQVDEAIEGVSDERVYLVDAGFGGLNLVQPIPLEHGAYAKGTLLEEHQIRYFEHPSSSLSSSTSSPIDQGQCYTLEVRSYRDKMGGELEHDWRTMFVFNTAEMFFESSYQPIYNDIMARHPLFTGHFIQSLHIPPEHPNGTFGRLTIFDAKVSRQLPGLEVEKYTFESESERVQALVRLFGVDELDSVEREEEAEKNIRTRGLHIKRADEDAGLLSWSGLGSWDPLAVVGYLRDMAIIY